MYGITKPCFWYTILAGGTAKIVATIDFFLSTIQFIGAVGAFTNTITDPGLRKTGMKFILTGKMIVGTFEL